MSRIIYERDEHHPMMTQSERNDLSDIGVWSRYLQDLYGSEDVLKGAAAALIDLRPALEAKYTNVYEYNLGKARRVYSAAYKELTGAEPTLMTYEQLTPSMLGRLTKHVEYATSVSTRV